jgi:hypothetical protein
MTIRISRTHVALAVVSILAIAAGASYVSTAGAGGTGVEAGPKAFVKLFGTDTGGATAAAGAACTLGEVLLTASTLKTAGGLPANGQLLPISQNQGLFALLGTTYGGDGTTTFALPDLRALAPDHMTYSICTNGVWPS